MEPGARIGPYTVLRELGAGGMGRVYLARTAAGRPVAVKVIGGTGPPDPEARVRFAREAALAARVHGRFTAEVIAADPEAPVPWIATEYVAAPSIEQLVRECGPLPSPAVRWLAAGIAEALVSVHGAGLVHRDVKPSNVLTPADGPRVIDFGISHAVDATRTVATLGTVAYVAPEQARGDTATTAADVYSLGSTLVFAATGHAPYGGSNVLEMLGQVAFQAPDLSGLPADLEPLVLACLQPQPADRPTPQSLLEEFAGDLADRPDAFGAAAWLPERFLAVIERYGRDGRRAAAASVPDAPTGLVPEPLATRLLSVPDGGQDTEEDTEEDEAQVVTPAPAPPPASSAAKKTGISGVGVVFLIVVALFFYNTYSENKAEAEKRQQAYEESVRKLQQSQQDQVKRQNEALDRQRDAATAAAAGPAGTSVDSAAFQKLKSGDCLRAWYDGDKFSTSSPEVVNCSADNAYLKVTGTSSTTEACPAREGTGAWPIAGQGRYLCVSRQFRKGECFPVKWSGPKSAPVIDKASLFTQADCNSSTVPSGFNNVLVITKYFGWTEAKGDPPCDRGVAVYYFWVLKEREAALCAEFPDN